MGVSELTEFLNDRAGDLHRGSARYDGDSSEVLYLRDDIREQRMRSEIDRMLNRVLPESRASEENAFPFGDLHATVRTFEEATILHFPTGSGRGVLVALESEAAQDLNTFVGQCLDRINQ